ncbi:N-acetylglucosamine kinase [Deinococcus apachensis]|uniref:N-acetylglucosamine kinase n=1 Tax=Deinococcus apachensis TaxID=309886 RepID=UPI00039C1AAB|nr:BadF/BadG/BcrA/BcrD ATPase family protein [Deinococcus apachensis]
MSPPDLVLGIDAGNTKTVALVADTSGRVLGWGRGGRGNIYVSKREALAAIDRAVLAALRMADAHAAHLRAAVLSATGADWPEDFVLLGAELESRGWGASRAVVNDALGALHAAAPDGTGVMVACGTGAGIAAAAPGGQTWHTGFWQEPGGAEDLGRMTLRAVYRADLGFDPPTLLTDRVLAAYRLPNVEALLHALTRRDRRPPGRVGRLARVLLDAAAAGDVTARGLVGRHGAALGDYALVAARRVGLGGTAFGLYAAGGVMRHPSPLLRDALLARVRGGEPGATPGEGGFEPVLGAALLALRAAHAGQPGGETIRGWRAALAATLPPDTLFRT